MHQHKTQHHSDGGTSHPHSSTTNKPLRTVLALCGIYMIAEIIGGIVSGSLALLADAGHMAVDTVAVGLGLFALWAAQKPPTPEKTYGYHRVEVLAALLNGATLIAVSGWIFYEAWHRFFAPVPVRGELMGGVALGGLVVNLIGLFLMHGRAHDSLNLRGIWLHLLGDTLGSVSAVVAAVCVWKFGWTWADPVISVLIAALILVGAFRLVLECVHVLLEGVPRGADVKKIRALLQSIEGVRDVHDLHIWAVSNGVIALSAHIRIDSQTDHTEVLRSINTGLREAHGIEHVTLQLEPPSFSHSEDLLHCQKNS